MLPEAVRAGIVAIDRQLGGLDFGDARNRDRCSPIVLLSPDSWGHPLRPLRRDCHIPLVSHASFSSHPTGDACRNRSFFGSVWSLGLVIYKALVHRGRPGRLRSLPPSPRGRERRHGPSGGGFLGPANLSEGFASSIADIVPILVLQRLGEGGDGQVSRPWWFGGRGVRFLSAS